jgi:hypothetical protein
MPRRHDHYRRLEPHPHDQSLGRGFRAEVHDPVWFLGRQWQLGEHQGENASSPAKVYIAYSESPIAPPAGDPRFDPRRTPAEVIVESEAGDWWTWGRRIRIDATVAANFDLSAAPEDVRLAAPPPPYERFDGQFDGERLWARRQELNIPQGAFGAELPPDDPVDMWNPTELVYTAKFASANGFLDLPRHTGGQIDWYAVDADAGKPPDVNAATVQQMTAYPSPLEYPGAPHPRWWQIENSAVDIGGYPPDRNHFATTLLIDLIASHSDDWFTVPVRTELGHILHLHQVEVEDIFGDRYVVDPPPTPPQVGGWSLFQTMGLPPNALVLWATVLTPLQGEVVERVLIGTDEDANLLWAVEQRANERELVSAENGANGVVAPDTIDAGQPKQFRYVPGMGAAPYWHPYQVAEVNGRRRFVQARLVDLSGATPQLMPEPTAKVLADPNASSTGPAHQIEPATLPAAGITIERRWMLARDTAGNPVLWIQRQRHPVLAPPSRLLRFDVLAALSV